MQVAKALKVGYFQIIGRTVAKNPLNVTWSIALVDDEDSYIVFQISSMTSQLMK